MWVVRGHSTGSIFPIKRGCNIYSGVCHTSSTSSVATEARVNLTLFQPLYCSRLPLPLLHHNFYCLSSSQSSLLPSFFLPHLALFYRFPSTSILPFFPPPPPFLHPLAPPTPFDSPPAPLTRIHLVILCKVLFPSHQAVKLLLNTSGSTSKSWIAVFKQQFRPGKCN